jgi:parallel beta-helix repeat protein
MKRPLPSLIAVSAATLAAWAGIAPVSSLAALITSTCGSVLTTDTTLSENLTNCPADGLVIGADDITLNLNSHTVSGDGLPAADGFDIGIRVEGHHGVTITNGSIQQFDRGVLLSASPAGVITALNVHNNSNRGIILDSGSDGGRITGNVSADNGTSAIVVVSSDGAVVTGNQSLRNQAVGVRLIAASHANVTGNILTSNGEGIDLGAGSNDNRVSDNSLTYDGEAGVGVGFSDRNIVTHNRVMQTGGGIILESADNTVITDNQVLHSPASACDGCGIGIQIYGNNNLVERNTVVDSPRYGIEVDDFQDPGHSPMTGTVLRDNIVNESGEGIAIGPETFGGVLNTLIQHNVVTGAVDDGIQLIGPSFGLETSTLTGNVTVHNGDFGIETVPGTIDGGGNHAAANGNPLQCLNITCH